MKGIYSPLDEAKHDVVHGYPGGAVALAPLVNMKPGTLSNKVNPTIDTHHLMVDEAVAIQAAAKDYRILYAEASALNHTCIQLADFSGISDVELLNAYAKLHKELGDMAHEINQALQDGKIMRIEFRRISKEMNQSVQAMFALRARMEALIDE